VEQRYELIKNNLALLDKKKAPAAERPGKKTSEPTRAKKRH
jgi:hypothetical protein